MLGEGAALPHLAVLVAGDDVGALKMRAQDLGLGGLAGLAGLHLDDVGRTQRQGAARRRGAGHVVQRHLRLDHAAELPDGEDGEFHARPWPFGPASSPAWAMTTSKGQFEAMRCGASIAQIFSIL
jgi:hypothetical protein